MAVVCFFKIFFSLFSGFCSHLFQVSGIWGSNRILSALSKRDSEALFCCSVSTIYSILLLISHYLEFYLLLPLLCHLSSGPAPSCSVPLPCTAEQPLFPSRLHFSELQNGLCRCLLHEFSACQMLWDMKLKIHMSVCICMWLFFVIMSGKEKVTREYMLWWLHHYPQQILFRKLLPVAEIKGLQVLRRWRLGFYFLLLLISSLQHDFPLHQFLTQAFCVGFCSGIWPTNVLKVERRAVLREEWLSTYVKAHILMKKQVLSLRKPWNEYGPFPWVEDKHK